MDQRDKRTEQMFSRHDLHKGAADAINKDGEKLLEAKQIGNLTGTEPPFKSRQQSVGTITDADIVGEPMMAWSDLSGRTVGRYFQMGSNLLALREDGYTSLRRLVEKAERMKPFSGRLSSIFLEEEIFRWWRETLLRRTDAPLSLHLLEKAEAAVARHTVMVPLANIEIEVPFRFGNVLITPMHDLPFDDFGKVAMQNHPDRADDVRAFRAELRRDLGHLTGVQTEVIGDIEYAREKARTVASDIADVLRLMSPAAATWNITFPCLPHGCDHDPSFTVLEIQNGNLTNISSGIQNAGFRWRAGAAEIDQRMKAGFQGCAAFFSGRKLTSFEQRVKTAISAHSRGIASYDQRDRLIYAISASEHLLLRDANEPIQTGVGDRMAFLVATDTDARQRVAANFKKAYGLRSRQIHHLSKIDDEQTLSEFFYNMSTMMLSAISNMPHFEEHTDFVGALDRMKYA